MQKRKLSGSEEILQGSVALEKLQLQGRIPKDLKPFRINTKGLRVAQDKIRKGKQLIINSKNIIFYGQIDRQGYPLTVSEKGIAIFPDGSVYEGRFLEGKPHGLGTLSHSEGLYKYEGNWDHGLPHGQGKETIGNNVYQGQFRLGKKHGNGTLTYEKDNCYEGQFRDNTIEGFGKYCCKNYMWEGQWADGYLEGKGKQTIAQKELSDLSHASEYEGSFKKGEKDGHGVFKWKRKYEYEGEFKKGQMHGQGAFKFKGMAYSGFWEDGNQIKLNKMPKTQRGESQIFSKRFRQCSEVTRTKPLYSHIDK